MKHLKRFKLNEDVHPGQTTPVKDQHSEGDVNCKYCSQCGKTNEGVTEPHQKFCADCGAIKIMAEGYLPNHQKVTTFAFVPRK